MKKLLAVITAAILLVTLAVPAFAADPATPPTAGADSKYAEVSGENEVKFNKYLISEDGQDLGDLGYDIKFTYEVTPGTAIAAADDKFEVKAGPMPEGDDKITVTTATFTNGSPTKNSSVQDGDKLALESGEVYQKQEVTIDFSKVKFPEPGIYRYVLTEQEISGATGVKYDTQKGSDATEKVRIVDVYVVDTEETGDGTPKLKIGSTVIHEVATTVNTTADKGSKDEKAGDDGKLADKSDGYVNEVDPVYDLHFSKEVKGNQGSRDKYFKFNLTITGLYPNQVVDLDGNWTKIITEANKGAATTYDHDVMTQANSIDENTKWMFNGEDHSSKQDAIDHAQSTVAQDAATQKWMFDGKAYDTKAEAYAAAEAACVAPRDGQQLKADSNGKIDKTFYLKHGEYISVLNLKKDAEYTLTEVAEDYKSEEKNNIVVGKACTDPVSDTMTKNTYTGFTNTRDGIIPTGVVMGFGGALLLIGAAVVYLVIRRRNAAYED